MNLEVFPLLRWSNGKRTCLTLTQVVLICWEFLHSRVVAPSAYAMYGPTREVALRKGLSVKSSTWNFKGIFTVILTLW